MEPIKMVDLNGQYLKIKSEIDYALLKIVESEAFINGPAVNAFSRNLETYLNVKHVIPCANGTDALQIALMALDLKPGDEVITPPFTFIATVEVVALLGLKPVFVDVHPDTFNLDCTKLEKAITEKTKAIVPVHLFGQSADLENIMGIADKYNIPVIEDNAQSIGAEYTFSNGSVKKLGTIATMGCISFFPSKNLGCYGDGGAICTNNSDLAEKLKQISNHGSKIKYYHDIIGINSRLDTLQAVILDIKLKQLDQYISARQEAAKQYDVAFSNHPKIKVPVRDIKSTHVFHQYTLQIDEHSRDPLKGYLNSFGIPAMIYYPFPLHLQNAYKYLGYRENDFPVTEKLCKTVLSLPMHTELNKEQIQLITDKVIEHASR
jgi:UDP-2-acetamido-2-deoxy-ribo-hexuluronate aminotransferase